MDSRVETATATGDLARTPRRALPIIDSERWLGPLLIGPAVLYIVLLVGLPFFMALYYSVSNTTTGGGTLGFVGLRNFTNVVGTPKFQTALKNTFVFALLSQAVILLLGNALALALQKDFRGKWFIRFLILLPWVAPISIGTIAWLWIFDSTYSVLNWTLTHGGIDPRTRLYVVRSATLGDGIYHRSSRLAPAPAGYSNSTGRTQLYSAGYPRCGCGGRRRLLAALLSDNACRSSFLSAWWRCFSA